MNNIIKKNISSVKNTIKNFSLNVNNLDNIIVIASLLIILVDFDIPNEMASLIDNDVTKVILYLSALSLFMSSSPLVAILALIAVQSLINMSSMVTGSSYLNEINHSEQTKAEYMEKLDHNNEVTLEEEMVETRAPLVRNKPVLNANYKPILEETHNATELNNNDL